jgi:hypothetical protein
MALKTYALLDVVGVKAQLHSGDTKPVKEFWSAADAWTNGVGNSLQPMRVLGKNQVQVPEVSVVTFSDSALVFTTPEFELDAFYKILGGLKQALESRVGKVYSIVSRGEDVGHHALPALGMTSLGGDMKPHYFNVAGTGKAWVDLHLADRAIGKKKEWHPKYTLYCVGANSKPHDVAAIDELTFRDFDDNDELLLALA